MHSNLAAITTPPLTSSLALALALLAPGCVLEITDFKESASSASSATTEVIEGTTTGGSASEGATSNSSTSVASTSSGSTTQTVSTVTGSGSTGPEEDVTTNATTDTPENHPACHAYTLDPEGGDAEACAAELGCADLLTLEDCQDSGYYNQETEQVVECRWGDILLDGVYIENEQICDGNVTHACVASTFLGDGGPPCSGYYHDFGGTLEVLNLECGTPIAGDWEPCYVDGDPMFPACDDCFPQLP